MEKAQDGSQDTDGQLATVPKTLILTMTEPV